MFSYMSVSCDVMIVSQKDVDEELMRKAKEGMMGDEAQFSVEMPLEKQLMVWSDKYKPRKPRFFNRVHTV